MTKLSAEIPDRAALGEAFAGFQGLETLAFARVLPLALVERSGALDHAFAAGDAVTMSCVFGVDGTPLATGTGMAEIAKAAAAAAIEALSR